ncbi:hypothetical protein IE53DRAFT_167456 [Violaceomyces palustris]|uniref:Uncharacterized protein n=1 Tax=Violaceomyces palustris TaxID=1673888 RepID=A0ACD0NT85_9BASI|nr:hypothetical protein IE53DRAFT_167456 [Violaceomyces palustris]
MAFFGGDSEEIKKLKKQLTSQDLIITNLQAEKQKLSSQLEDTISTSQRNASQLAKETERALESESQLSKLRNENVQLSLRLANFETVLHDSKEREKVSIKNARQLESQIDLTNSCSAEEERRRSEADQKKIRSLESDVSRLEAQLRSQQDQVSNGAFGNVRRGRNVDPATKLIALENELMSLRSENQRLGKLVSANPSCSSKSSDPSSSPIKSNPDHQGALTNGFAFASPVRSIRAGGARRPRSSSVNGSEEPRLIRLTSEVTELKSMLSESQKESNEARTKLEKAERNLLKVENEKLASVIGLERSIQSLKDEVERLGDDLRWKEEMVSELKVELKNSESQSRRAREEVEEMRKIKADLERKVEEGVVSRSSSKPDPRSKELEEKCFGLETEIERLQQEVLRRRGDHREEGAEEEEEDREGSIRERIGQLETIIDQLEKELENKDEEMARVKKELEIVQSERLEIQERLEDEEKRGKEGGGGDGREGRFDREEALEREVDELVRERETFKGKYRDLKREFEIYRDEVQATRVRNEREPKPEVGKSEKEEGNREDRTAEIQSLRSRLSNLEMELFAAVEENEQLGSEREALVEELERSKERLERLRDSFRIREKELDELQTIAEKVAHQLEISEDKVDALEKQDRVKTLEIQALKAKEGAGQDVVQETFESLRQEILKRDSEHSELVEVLRRRERELKAGRKLLRNLSSSLFSYTPLKGGVLIGNGGGGDDSNSSKVEEEEDHQVLEESSFTSFSFNSLSGGGEDRSIQLERGFEEDLLDEVEQVKLSWEVARTRVEFCRVEEGLKLQRAEQDVKQNLVKIRQLEKILNQSETRGGEGGEDERDSLARELELAREEIERLRLVEKESEKMKAQLEELGDRLDRAERRSESIARLAESLESKRRRLESIESNRSRLETIEADARQREENLERFRELNQLHLSEVATWMVQAKETIQALNLANSRVAELHAQLHQVTTLGDSEEEGGSASVDDDVAELERARSKAAQATVRVEELEVQLASCKREVEEISEVKLGLELEIRELSSVVQSVETGMVEKESILQGLKETVERLESQLEEAQTREAIRDRELESARRDRADFESRLMLEIEEKARRVVEEEESFKAKQRQSDEHLDQIRKQLEIEVKEVSRLTEELSSMTSRKEQACQEVVVLRDKVEDLERREIKIREDSRRQAAELAEKTSELEARVLRRTEQIGQHQRDLESIRLEMDKVKMNQTLAEENCIELNEEKDELEQKVVGLEAQLQKVKAELESAREGKSSSEGTSAEQEDLERYRSEAVKLGGELERCRAELIEVEQSMLKVQEESRVKVDSLLEDLERAEADKVSLEGRISSSQQRVEDLDTIVERGRQEMERIEHQLCSERESQEKALENLKEKLVHVEVELERALTKVEEEARERSRLEVELASSRQEAETHREAAIEAQQAVAHHALALSDSVENAEVLRTKVVQLEQIEQERVKLREMLDQKALLMEELEIKVSQASAKENETILKLRAEKEESQAEVEKLSEKVRELEVWLSEVEEAAKSKEESRFASESRILELEALKEEDEVKVKRMKDQVESLDLQLSQARESLKVTQELVEQLRLDSSTKVSSCELEKARSELKQLEEEHSSALDRIGQLESVKESMEKEISDLRRQSRDSPNSEPLSGEQALLSKVQQLEVERDQIREESDRIVRESREEKEVMESEMTRSRDEMHKVERELETLRSQHDQMLTEMADSRNLASTSEERLRQVLSDSQAELDGLKSQLDSISSEKEATESKLDFRIQELTSLAEQVESDHAKAVEESSIKNREVMEKLESQLEGSSKAVEELEARLISLEAERDEALRRYQGLVDQIDEKDEQGRIKIQEVQARLEEAKSSSADQLELLKAKITEKDERVLVSEGGARRTPRAG